MRSTIILTALTVLTMDGSALAQSGKNADYSAGAGGSMYDRPMMSNHMTIYSQHGPRTHALGSMRHPTVGNIANQRVNGG